MITDEQMLRLVSEKVIGAAYRVGNKLGHGFMEKCYENALAHELRKAGIKVEQQVKLQVWYEDVVVGEYVADLVVEGSLIIEIKAVENLAPIHSAQCINYLAATNMPLCLLINFSKRVEVKRLAGKSLNSLPSSV